MTVLLSYLFLLTFNFPFCTCVSNISNGIVWFLFTLVSRILYVNQVYPYKINNVKKNDFLLLGYLNYFSVWHLFYQLLSALIEPKTFLSMRTQMQALLPLCFESNTLPILTPTFLFFILLHCIVSVALSLWFEKSADNKPLSRLPRVTIAGCCMARFWQLTIDGQILPFLFVRLHFTSPRSAILHNLFFTHNYVLKSNDISANHLLLVFNF